MPPVCRHDSAQLSRNSANFAERPPERHEIQNACRERVPYFTKDFIDHRGIVSFTISSSSLTAHANELADMVVGVLRMSSSEYLATAVEQYTRLGRRQYHILGKSTRGIGSSVDVSLNPGVDGDFATAGQYDATANDADCRGDIV